MAVTLEQKQGLIAGDGLLPVKMAQHAKENGFDNGCIINTVSQVTANPNRITIAVNKANKTHDMVLATGEFNVSILAN